MAGCCRSLGHSRVLFRRLLRISSPPNSCESVYTTAMVLLWPVDVTLDTLIADDTHFQYISPQPRHDHPRGLNNLATAPLRVYVFLCCVGARYATIRTHRTPQKHHCTSRIHMQYLLERNGAFRTKLHSRIVQDHTAGLLQTRYRSHCSHGAYSSECSKVAASAFRDNAASAGALKGCPWVLVISNGNC